MEREKLSSRLTFIMKVTVPLFVTSTLSLLTVAIWLADLHGGKAPPMGAKWALLALLIGWLIGCWLSSGSLKRIEIDNEMLYISDFLREDVVPLSQIESVSEIHSYPRQVKIVLRQDTGDGKIVLFIPSLRTLFRIDQPMSTYLQKRAKLPILCD